MKAIFAQLISAIVLFAVPVLAQTNDTAVPLFKHATIEQTEKSLV